MSFMNEPEFERQKQQEHWIRENLPKPFRFYEDYGIYPTVELSVPQQLAEVTASAIQSRLEAEGFTTEQVEVNPYMADEEVTLVVNAWLFDSPDHVKQCLSLALSAFLDLNQPVNNPTQ